MNSTSKKLEYAKFLSTLEEEECRALTEEVTIILATTSLFNPSFFLCEVYFTLLIAGDLSAVS